MYKVDEAANSVLFRALDSDYRTRFPLEPFHGTTGVAPAASRRRRKQAQPAIEALTSPAPCSRWGMATMQWGRVRPAASQSRAR
jgi:hypothetical protein